MQMNKYLPATGAVFVWYLIWDNLIGPNLLGSVMGSIPGAVAQYSKMWEVIGDLTAAAVLVWFFNKVRGSFGAGARGGATFGLAAGIVMHFPTYLWFSLYFGWPYRSVWISTVVLVAMVTISGAVIGFVYEKLDAPKGA